MQTKKKGYLVLFVVLLLIITTGCSGKTNNQSGQQENVAAVESNSPVIVRLEGGDYGLSQPFTSYSRGPGMFKVKLVFDSLIERDSHGYIPWLAESWEVLDGGTKYVFKLREDVSWADGQPFTAEDVVFTFNYIQKHTPAGASRLVQDDKLLKQIKAVGKYQVDFILSEPNPNMIEAVNSINIIPKHLWENVERPDEFTSQEALIGTGPFKLTHYSKEHGTYRFEARQDFWGPSPAVDVIEFIPVSDPVLALEKGDIDLSVIPVDSLNRFAANPDFTVIENPGVWGYRLRFNMQKVPELQQREVRQAFAYSIDRQDIVEKIARGAGVPGSMGILPPVHLWYNPDLPKYERDTERALVLLNQAEKSIKDKEFELLVGGGIEVRMAEVIKEQLAEIGVKIRVTSADSRTRDARVADGNYQLVITGHGGWARDADYLRTRFANTKDGWSSGTPGYENPEFSRLIELQKSEIDNNVRKEIFMEIQQILAQDVPEIPLYMRTGHTVFRNTTYAGWQHEFDHHETTHNKLSFLNY